MPESVGCNLETQVLARRVCITDMELNGLSRLEHLADGQTPGAAVRAEEVPHQEVSPLESVAVLVDDDTEVEGALSKLLIFVT